MIIKCICINCEFYLSCWINKSLFNFPVNYGILIRKKKSKFFKEGYKSLTYLPTLLIIQLHIHSNVHKIEPDIVFCDAFVEKPGSWINLYIPKQE